MTSTEKEKIISQYRISDKDTGSVQLQIALLTEHIKRLTVHLQENKKLHLPIIYLSDLPKPVLLFVSMRLNKLNMKIYFCKGFLEKNLSPIQKFQQL